MALPNLAAITILVPCVGRPSVEPSAELTAMGSGVDFQFSTEYKTTLYRRSEGDA